MNYRRTALPLMLAVLCSCACPTAGRPTLPPNRPRAIIYVTAQNDSVVATPSEDFCPTVCNGVEIAQPAICYAPHYACGDEDGTLVIDVDGNEYSFNKDKQCCTNVHPGDEVFDNLVSGWRRVSGHPLIGLQLVAQRTPSGCLHVNTSVGSQSWRVHHHPGGTTEHFRETREARVWTYRWISETQFIRELAAAHDGKERSR